MGFVGSEVHGTVHPLLNVGTDGWEGEALGRDISTYGAGLVSGYHHMPIGNYTKFLVWTIYKVSCVTIV